MSCSSSRANIGRSRTSAPKQDENRRHRSALVAAVWFNVLHPSSISFLYSLFLKDHLYINLLQQHLVSHVLYTQRFILEIIFSFNFLYILICHTLKYIVHILVLQNRLFKVFKWIENRL
jgi:hypothetical protein